MVDILASNIHTPKKPMPPPKRRVEARARKMSFNMVVIFMSYQIISSSGICR